jgi:Tol biopolymer transport system component
LGGGWLSPDGSRVLFTGDKKLYSAPVDGSAPAIVISQGAEYGLSGLSIGALVFMPDGESVVYSAELAYSYYALYRAPLDEAGRARRFTPDGNAGVDRPRPLQFELSPDGERVVFLSDQDTRGVVELFTTSIVPSMRRGRLTVR